MAGYKVALGKILRRNASVISTLAQLNHPIAGIAAQQARSIPTNILYEKAEFPDDMVLGAYKNRPELIERFNQEISRIDTGVNAVEIITGENGPLFRFRHQGLSFPIPAFSESHGTRQFLKLFPLISEALASGSIAIIDELDASIHPMILGEIIDWFHDPDLNRFNSQLWMSCQNVSILEQLSKDEIVFCEKDRRGSTEVYGLNDIKGARRNTNHYRKYLGGVYGAVPHIG